MTFSFYSNYVWGDSFEEMINWMPKFYREVTEMLAVLEAESHAENQLMEDIDTVYKNNFVDYMDENTIAKFEEWFGISNAATRTVEERRRYLKAFFIGFGKVSASSIAEMIYGYTNADAEITFDVCDLAENNALYIRMDRGDIDTLSLEDVVDLLKKRVPAHIYCVISLQDSNEMKFTSSSAYLKTLYKMCGMDEI